MITQKRLKEVLDYDPCSGLFTRKCKSKKQPFGKGSQKDIGSVCGTQDAKGYIGISIDGKRYAAHRLAWLYVTGCWPSDQIDHINRVKSDNRACNIRDVPQLINLINKNCVKITPFRQLALDSFESLAEIIK